MACIQERIDALHRLAPFEKEMEGKENSMLSIPQAHRVISKKKRLLIGESDSMSR